VSWHLAEAGHASILWSGSDQVEMDGLSGLDFKTTMQAGLHVWVLKPGAEEGVCPCGRIVVMEGM